MERRNYYISIKEMGNFLFSHSILLSSWPICTVTQQSDQQLSPYHLFRDQRNSFPDSHFFCRTNYDYYLHYNPLRVVNFHIIPRALFKLLSQKTSFFIDKKSTSSCRF